MTTYRIAIMFTAPDDLTVEELELLATQAAYQIEDPRDDDGGPTRFETSNVHTEAEEY